MLDRRFDAFDLRSYGDTQITLARRAQGEEVARDDQAAVPGQL